MTVWIVQEYYDGDVSLKAFATRAGARACGRAILDEEFEELTPAEADTRTQMLDDWKAQARRREIDIMLADYDRRLAIFPLEVHTDGP